MGFMDGQGYTKIVDRKKDMILVSGFNVYPNELEEIVALHPGVLEVAAIGVPDEHSGEVPKLFVVRKDPDLTEAMLIAYCKENFTGYKRPRLHRVPQGAAEDAGGQDFAQGVAGVGLTGDVAGCVARCQGQRHRQTWRRLLRLRGGNVADLLQLW